MYLEFLFEIIYLFIYFVLINRIPSLLKHMRQKILFASIANFIEKDVKRRRRNRKF